MALFWGQGRPVAGSNAPGDNARAALFAHLDAHAIAHETVAHPPIFTVAEGRDIKANMPGRHTKNLFLRDKAKRLFLAVAHGETTVDLVALGKAMRCGGGPDVRGRLSFGRPETLLSVLGVRPGSVSPLALINDNAHAVTHVWLDTALMANSGTPASAATRIWVHPLENTASTAISPQGLRQFLDSLGCAYSIVDLADPHPAGLGSKWSP